jgi:hypothetical protein
MSKFLKLMVTILVVSVLVWLSSSFYNYVLVGGYINNAPLNAVFMGVALVTAIYFAVIYLRKMWVMLGLLFGLFILQGCNYAKSNQQVLVSDDCGVSWRMITAGQSVPKGGVNPCYMKVVVPNYSMQGNASFIANLKDKVKVRTLIDYDYNITDPLSFIKQAKYLGSANADADSDAALNANAFEGAENRVIDVRIRDVAKSILINEDIVELDQAELEDLLLEKINEVLKTRGVLLNFITLNFIPDEQTNQAIDVATAMKIYESKGLGDLGKQVISARAGATKISVTNKGNDEAKTEEE